jgi:hypothetical protein
MFLSYPLVYVRDQVVHVQIREAASAHSQKGQDLWTVLMQLGSLRRLIQATPFSWLKYKSARQ